MRKDYEITNHNSTVRGYPGRDFDWGKFHWEGKQIFKSIFKGEKDYKSPKPWKDDGLIGKGSQYLHVPYDFTEQGTIYRVRPNESMRAGEVYRGRLIKRQTAIEKQGKWYWRLEFQ